MTTDSSPPYSTPASASHPAPPGLQKRWGWMRRRWRRVALSAMALVLVSGAAAAYIITSSLSGCAIYTEGVACMAWNADNSRLVVCYGNSKSHIVSWTKEGNCKVKVLDTHFDSGRGYNIISEVSWSPDGSAIALMYGGGLVLLDAETGLERTKSKAYLSTSERDEYKVAWSPDSKKFAVAHDKDVRLYDGADPLRYETVHVSGEYYYNTQALAWSPDGARIAQVTSDALWLYTFKDADRGIVAQTLEYKLRDTRMPAWSPNSNRIAMWAQFTEGTRAKIWSASSVITMPVLLEMAGKPDSPNDAFLHGLDLVWSTDAKRIAGAYEIKRYLNTGDSKDDPPATAGITWWNAVSGHPLAWMAVPNAINSMKLHYIAHINVPELPRIAISPDTSKVAVATNVESRYAYDDRWMASYSIIYLQRVPSEAFMPIARAPVLSRRGAEISFSVAPQTTLPPGISSSKAGAESSRPQAKQNRTTVP